jgi:hypothetical protein
MSYKHGQWYIRKDGEITGPFNGSVIMNHLIVGRLKMQDEVSADKQHWLPLSQQTALHPDSKIDDKNRRRLDERSGLDRRREKSAVVDAGIERGPDRRSLEPELSQRRRLLHRQLMQQYRQRRERLFWPLMATFSLLIALTLLATFFPTTLPLPLPNCNAAASPGVNWNNCLKSRVDLANQDLSAAKMRNSQLDNANLMNTLLDKADIAYANLRFANLSYSRLQNASLFGSNLSQADLSNADLRGADLAYADLRHAKLGGADLTGARLAHTIWIDGRTCADNAVGQCDTATAN